MSTAGSTIPSLYEELNRKAVDALVWLKEGEESGQITPDQMYVARQALFTALAGLLSPEINELLSAVASENTEVRQEVCIKDNILAVLTMGARGNVNVYRAPIDATRVTVKSFPGNSNGTGLYRQVRSKLYATGFQPLNAGETSDR